MSDMKRLIEKMDQFAGQAVGQKPGDQVRGTEKATKRKDNKHPFAGRLVGASESKSLLADLEKELVEGAVKRSLAEQFAEFKEATMTPQQVAAAKAAAPYGYNPQTGKPNPAPAAQAQPAQPAANSEQAMLDKLGARAGATPGSNTQQVGDAYEQKILDRMGKRFGLAPGATAEQVQAAQQAYLDKNDPAAAAQYKQNMANIDAGNTAATKPVALTNPYSADNVAAAGAQVQGKLAPAPTAQPAATATQDPNFAAGLAAQKAGGSPIDIMLAQPNIANNQQLVDAIGSVYGLPPGSTVEQVKAAAKGKPAAPQPAVPAQPAIAESRVQYEGLTPEREFLSKEERLKAGDKVYYKGRFVGVATGHLDGDRVVFTPVEGYGTSPDFASLPIDIISLRESNQFSDLELAIMEGGNSLDDGSDMFADRNTQKIGLAIIKAGKETIADAPRRWKGDKSMIKFMTNDGNDMINVGKVYLEQGMEAGNTAFWDLDTAVRDGIYDAVLKDAGIDMNDILDEGTEHSVYEDSEQFGYKRLHPEIFKARQQFPLAKSDMEALLMYVHSQEEQDIRRVDRVNDREDAEIEQLDKEENSLERRLEELSAQLEKLKSQAKTVKEEVPAPVATAGGPAGANQPKTPPGVTPKVDPAQQALLKQNQSKLQQNLANLKSAGVQIDPAKAAQTLQKTDTGAPMNAMDKDNIAAMAPAIGNVMANPQTATQLNTLIKKAGGGV
jgi:hypothetical protein